MIVAREQLEQSYKSKFNELRTEAEKGHCAVEQLSADVSDATKCNKQLKAEIDKLKAEFEQSQSQVAKQEKMLQHKDSKIQWRDAELKRLLTTIDIKVRTYVRYRTNCVDRN